MLTITFRKAAVAWLAFLAAFMISSGCGQPDSASKTPAVEDLDSLVTPASPVRDQVDSTTTGTPPPPREVDAGGVPPVWFAASLRTMVEQYDTILVGQVTEVVVTRYRASGSAILHDPPLQGDPETVLSVQVLRVIASPRAKDGDIISLLEPGIITQQGGVFQLEPHAFNEQGEIIKVGAPRPAFDHGVTYLLFLRDLQPEFGLDEYVLPTFGLFIINADDRIQPNGWDGEPGVSAISGVPYSEVQPALYAPNPEEALAALARVTVDEAAATILAAIAEGPLPTPQP